jgi:hypothetical protein
MMLAAQPANPRHRGTGRFRPREAVTDRLAITLLMALAYTPAHAQPSSWQSHSDGYLTRYQGTDGNGEPWTGTSYQSGFTTYFDANGPHGALPVVAAGVADDQRVRLRPLQRSRGGR